MTRWHCRICKTWGLGGPDGWRKHHKSEHVDGNHYGASMSFGFSPNYGDGKRTRYWDDYRPAPRCEDTP